MATCFNYTPHHFTPNQCCECFQMKEKHLSNAIITSQEELHLPHMNSQLLTPIANRRKSFQKPTSTDSRISVEIPNGTSIRQDHSPARVVEHNRHNGTVTSSHVQINSNSNTQNTSSEQQPTSDSTTSTIQKPNATRKKTKKPTPCKYGLECYRKNPVHLEQYSHPPGFRVKETIIDQPTEVKSATQTIIDPTVVASEVSQTSSQKHHELVEERFRASLMELQNDKEYYEQEIKKLRKEKKRMATYHQQLEHALALELDNRERREIEQQRILAIPRDTPSYWGMNAFDQPYREIDIRPESPEFTIINDLLNSTIEEHDNKYGTIYGKDPTEFIVTKILRIQNDKLWREYCFKKESIIRKNKNQLMDYEGSKHLKSHPLLTPLLDAYANEYWLFHGCNEGIIPVLLHYGYDPRVSSVCGMFGGGFYLAENSSKSNQYIPCPGCKRNALFYNKGCKCRNQDDLEFAMILYRAVLGDVHVAKKYDEKIYRGEDKHPVRRPPLKDNSCNLHDSVMGESIKYGGNKLKYREFVLYELGQAYPEYVIKFKRSASTARAPSDAKRMMDKCYRFLTNIRNLRYE